ncbi:MAG: response regulator [Thermodesulfobacteriota bacterium]
MITCAEFSILYLTILFERHPTRKRSAKGGLCRPLYIQVVGEAANGREAWEEARQLQPDLIVMDISMPEMVGIEATRHIKSEMPAVRVIGLSMHRDEAIVHSILEAGADGFVSKSASAAELLSAIYGVRRAN